LQKLKDQNGSFSDAFTSMATAITQVSSNQETTALSQCLEKSAQLSRYRQEAESLRHKRLKEFNAINITEMNPISTLPCE
jgi:hypothetical protein